MIKKLWAHRLVGFAMFLGVAFGSGGMYYYAKKNFTPTVYNLEEVVTEVDMSIPEKDILHSPFTTDTRTWYVTSAELLTIREGSWHSRMVKVKVFTDAKVFVFLVWLWARARRLLAFFPTTTVTPPFISLPRVAQQLFSKTNEKSIVFPMSKAVDHGIVALRGWQRELRDKITLLEGHVESFCWVSQEYDAFIRRQFKGKLDLATNASFMYAVQNWLRSFVAILDECFIYYTGAFSRTSYFADEHGPHEHDRGPQEKEYEKIECRSRLSMDGLDYEYRRLKKQVEDMPRGRRANDLEDKLVDFENEADALSTRMNAFDKRVNAAFWDTVAGALKHVGATSVDTRQTQNKHGNASVRNNEYIRATFPSSDGTQELLEFERSKLPRFTRETGLARMADVEDACEAGAAPAPRRGGHSSKRVVMDDDDDDEPAPARAGAAKPAPEVFDFSVNQIIEDVDSKYQRPPPPLPPPPRAPQAATHPRPAGGGAPDDQQGLLTSDAVLAFANALGGGSAGMSGGAASADGQPASGEGEGESGDWWAGAESAHVVVLEQLSEPPPAALIDPAFAGHPAVAAYACRVADAVGACVRGNAVEGVGDAHAALEEAVRPIVAATCAVLAAAAATTAAAGGLAVRAAVLDVSHAVLPGAASQPLRGLYEAVFEVSLAAAAAAWPPGRCPAVDMSSVGVGGRVLAAAMLAASAVVASGCDFDADEAADAAAHIRAATATATATATASAAAAAAEGVRMDVDGEGPAHPLPHPHRHPPLTSLVLRSNRFFATDLCSGGGSAVPGPVSPLPPTVAELADAPGTDVDAPDAEESSERCLLAAALGNFPAMAALDISHCAASEAEWARLSTGLCRALRLRRRRGLPPLDTLTIRGLAQAWPALAAALARAVAPEFVILTDFGGAQRALTLQM